MPCLANFGHLSDQPLNSRGSLIIGYAQDGFELWELILCVQICCLFYKMRRLLIIFDILGAGFSAEERGTNQRRFYHSHATLFS